MTLFSFARVIKLHLLLPLRLVLLLILLHFLLFLVELYSRDKEVLGDFIKCNNCEEPVGSLCRWCLAERCSGVGRR